MLTLGSCLFSRLIVIVPCLFMHLVCFHTLLPSSLAYSCILFVFTPCCYHALLTHASCLFSHLVAIVPCLLMHLACFHTLLLSCLTSCLFPCLVVKPCFPLCLAALMLHLIYSHALLLLHLACFCALLLSCFAYSYLVTFTPYYSRLCSYA
jgi:hypothetical protein